MKERKRKEMEETKRRWEKRLKLRKNSGHGKSRKVPKAGEKGVVNGEMSKVKARSGKEQGSGQSEQGGIA